jgi:hypothetical protein
VTKWTAAAGAALMAAFAVYAASANPGRSNATSGATTSAPEDDGDRVGVPAPAVPGGGTQQAPVSRHTTTGGS